MNWHQQNWHPVMIDETGTLRGGPADSPSDPDRHGDMAVEEAKPKLKPPSMYKVLMLNDDYTPMEFVIVVLMRIFGMGQEKATEVMLNVHRSGVGVCGVYSFEVAETKVTQVMGLAQRNEHPLQCTMEKD